MTKQIPQKDMVEVISKTLKQIDNTSRRDRLLSFLPEEERRLVNSRVAPTLWQAVRETAELMYGNSSFEVQRRAHSAYNKNSKNDQGDTR